MKELGMDYLNAWNIIDLFQLLIFWVMFIEKIIDISNKEYDNDFNASKVLRIFLILTSVMKVIHFIVIFEQFGYFIKMLIKCLEGQVPFIVTYILYILFFVNLYATL